MAYLLFFHPVTNIITITMTHSYPLYNLPSSVFLLTHIYYFCIYLIPPLSLPSLLSPEVTLPVTIIAITTTHSYPHYSLPSSVILPSFIHILLSCASFITSFRLFSFSHLKSLSPYNDSFLSTLVFPVLVVSTFSHITSFLVLLGSLISA